ncbi:hypothetical protein V5G28_018325 [Scytonema sp. PRP1]
MKPEVATGCIKAFGERFGQAPSCDRGARPTPQSKRVIQCFAELFHSVRQPHPSRC